MELVEYLNIHPNFWWLNPGRYFDKVYFPMSERHGKRCYTPEDRNNIVKRLRGLSEIVDVIREHNIPLVGHNFGLDLLYFFQMFCTDLPGMIKKIYIFVNIYVYINNKLYVFFMQKIMKDSNWKSEIFFLIFMIQSL
jgi:hypothetical protein